MMLIVTCHEVKNSIAFLYIHMHSLQVLCNQRLVMHVDDKNPKTEFPCELPSIAIPQHPKSKHHGLLRIQQRLTISLLYKLPFGFI